MIMSIHVPWGIVKLVGSCIKFNLRDKTFVRVALTAKSDDDQANNWHQNLPVKKMNVAFQDFCNIWTNYVPIIN